MRQHTALVHSSLISQTWHNATSRFSTIVGNKKDEIDFQSNGVLTLGVEIELQLIDKTTLNLTSRAEELLQATHDLEKVKPELHLTAVEINTGKCSTVQEVEEDFQATMGTLNTRSGQLDIALATTGTHPFARYAECPILQTDRYQELIDRNQWLTRRMMVYGLHVHIGMESGDDCIRYNNFFMYFLPHLVALSASSPFWQSVDTGLSACRPTLYEAIPTAGQPYHVRNWKEFENLYESLKKCGSIKVMKDLWWDIRPSPVYGTLEIRVCDGCATLYETLAITAFVHLLAHWFADHGSWLESVNYPPRWLSRENKWRAIRHGLDADVVMNTEGKTKLLREDIQEWAEKLKPYAKKLGYQTYLSNLLTLLEHGTSSERQRIIFQKTGSLEEVVRFNNAEFLSQKPLWDYNS